MIYLNGFEIVPTKFPDNTSQVWKLPEGVFNGSQDRIQWNFQQEAEFFHLAQLKMLLDSRKSNLITLHLKYLPYGRQDKKVSNDATFALNTFAKLLNSLKFDVVTILDPHSKEALDLIKNSVAVYPINAVRDTIATCFY